MTDVSGLYSLLDSLVIGSYVKMLVRRVLSDKIKSKTRTIPVPRSRNISDVSGLYSSSNLSSS